MKKAIVFLALLIPTVASAQDQSADRYWQQLLASKEVQSSQQIIDLARQLDAARAQIATLTKQLADEKTKNKPQVDQQK